MEDIFSLLIYLAILVIGGIASAYRKKKVKQPPFKSPVPQNRPKTFDPFEEILRELREEKMDEEPEYEIPEKRVEPAPIFERIPEKKPVIEKETMLEEIPQYEAKSLEEPFSEAVSLETITPDYNSVKEQAAYHINRNEITDNEISDTIGKFNYEEDTIEEELDFDLKKAVIYTEILKRKDF